MPESALVVAPELLQPEALAHWRFVVVCLGNTVSAEQGRAPARSSRLSADFQRLVDQESHELVERIELKLAEDREDADRTEDVAPSEAAAQVCLQLARRLAPHLALAPQLKAGAFTEDDGGVSLVFQSLVTDRRLSCRIPPDGTHISAIRIDEGMRADRGPVLVSHPDAPRELAEWVTKRV